MDGFLDTPVGRVPCVRTHPRPSDRLGTLRARVGYHRNDYLVIPGLYALGEPTPESPVVVTANYKLTFDTVRYALRGFAPITSGGRTENRPATSSGEDPADPRNFPGIWLLVADTRGINVWCAGGKGLFSAAVVARAVQEANLERVVSHRRLILPQLAANGVEARAVRRQCGFQAEFGPIRAADLPEYLRTGSATPQMRRATFTMAERAVLIPVELFLLLRPLLLAAIGALLFSGIGPDVFSIARVLARGPFLLAALFGGVVAGAAIMPLLLPWLPPREFSHKGVLAGLPMAVAASLALLLTPHVPPEATAGAVRLLVESGALILCCLAAASYLAMNFTGSTPFTSPSGVEREMRRALPWQAGAMTIAVAAWLAGPFL